MRVNGSGTTGRWRTSGEAHPNGYANAKAQRAHSAAVVMTLANHGLRPITVFEKDTLLAETHMSLAAAVRRGGADPGV